MMKKISIFLVTMLNLFFVRGALAANTYSFIPDTSLGDLAHASAFEWHLDGNSIKTKLQTSQDVIISATLTFTNIRNWDTSSNVLFMNLLDTRFYSGYRDPDGDNNFVRTYSDSSTEEVNYFDVSNYTKYPATYLGNYTNISINGSTLNYVFSGNALATLTSYINNDGYFGIGIDPDCHYYDDGVSLQIITGTSSTPPNNSSPVPEPATLLLFGSGLVALAWVGRKHVKK
jgi:hypothetical protein